MDPAGTATDQRIAQLLTQLAQYERMARKSLSSDQGDDVMQDAALAIVEQARRGAVVEHQPSYVGRIIVRARIRVRNAGQPVEVPVMVDPSPTPEALAIEQQEQAVGRRTLQLVPQREREVLSRFYLDEQPKEQIEREMGIAPQAFGVVKSRAKSEFARKGRAMLKIAA